MFPVKYRFYAASNDLNQEVEIGCVDLRMMLCSDEGCG